MGIDHVPVTLQHHWVVSGHLLEHHLKCAFIDRADFHQEQDRNCGRMTAGDMPVSSDTWWCRQGLPPRTAAVVLTMLARYITVP